MNEDLTSILGEPENKPTSDLVSILGEPELKKKEPSVSESSDGRYYAVSTPDRQLLETGEVTKTGQPKEDKQKATVLAGIKSPEERTVVSKAIDLTNEGYEGVMTPYQKMTEFSNQVKELNKSVDAKAIASMDKTALDKFQSDYKKKAHDIAVNLGLQVDEAGNVKPYEEESQRYADKLNFNIGLLSQKQKPEEKGFFGNLITALGAGQERASGAALDLLGFVTGLNYFDSYKDLAKGNRYNAQALSEQANKYDQSIENYMAQGDITKAAGAAITGAAESLPYMIPAMVNPEYGAYVMGSMAGIDQYRNLETKDIPEWARVANALQTAAWEAIFEDVGTASILSRSKQAMLELGEKQGKEAILNAVNKTVENSASKLGKMPEWVKEGLSEVATGIGEDITDKVTYNPDAKIGSHAVDDFTVGAVMGKLFSIPQDIAKFADRKAVRDYSQKIIDSLPVDMDIPTKVELGWKIAERNKLQEAEDRLDEKFKGKYTDKINAINSDIDNVISKWKETQKDGVGEGATEGIKPEVTIPEVKPTEVKVEQPTTESIPVDIKKSIENIPEVKEDIEWAKEKLLDQNLTESEKEYFNNIINDPLSNYKNTLTLYDDYLNSGDQELVNIANTRIAEAKNKIDKINDVLSKSKQTQPEVVQEQPITDIKVEEPKAVGQSEAPVVDTGKKEQLTTLDTKEPHEMTSDEYESEREKSVGIFNRARYISNKIFNWSGTDGLYQKYIVEKLGRKPIEKGLNKVFEDTSIPDIEDYMRFLLKNNAKFFTQEDYDTYLKYKSYMDRGINPYIKNHKTLVEIAAFDGKNIPENVLEEYPDLSTQIKQQKLSLEQQKTGIKTQKVEEATIAPQVEETAVKEPEISFTDVKDRVGRPIYESEEQAKTDYDTNALKEHEETYDEFLRRKHCSGIKPRNFSLK